MNSDPKPFRFLTCWTQDDKFDDLVRRNWKQTGTIYTKLKHLKTSIKKWNKGSFRKISERVMAATSNLEDIQEKIQKNPGDLSLSIEENKAQFIMSKVLKEEELFARQKSRALHISSGDSNTRYFYNAMAVRKVKNGIHKIETPGGTLTKSKDIADEAVKFFF